MSIGVVAASFVSDTAPAEDLLLFSMDTDGYIITNKAYLPGGVVSPNDVVVCQDAADPYSPLGVKINADGTADAGDSVAIPDPDVNGATYIGPVLDAGGAGWLTTNTLDDGQTIQLRKFAVDTDTLVATEQDMYQRTFVGTYSFTPQTNHFVSAVFDMDDATSGQTSHEFRLIPFDETGFGTPSASTLDTTGLTGFDSGSIFSIAASRYFTNYNRWFKVDSDGTILQQPILGTDIADLYDLYSFESVGCVQNCFFSGDDDELFIQTGDGGTVTQTPLTDYFGAGVWKGQAFWTHGGEVYLGATSDDQLTAKVVKDLLGSPSVHTFVDTGHETIPVGMTSRGELMTITEDGTHYAIFAFGVGVPVEIPWHDFDLSTADFITYAGVTHGQYSGGELIPLTGSNPAFHFPGFALDPAGTYEIELTTNPDTYFGVMFIDTDPPATFGDNYELFYSFPSESVILATVGPGIDDWDAGVTAGYDLVRFDAALVYSMRWRQIS